MEEFKNPLKHYDLLRFIGELFELRSNDISASIIVCFSEEGALDELGVEEINLDLVKNLLLQGRILFLPFSDINVGEPIPCADGKRYSLSAPDDLDDEVAISAELVESVGFLVRVEEGEVIICGAVFSGGDYYPIEVGEMDGDVQEFCEPMGQFVERFRVD